MKKIIVAIDAITYNEYALEHAIQFAQASGGMVLGVFLHDMSYIYSDLPGVFTLVPTQYTNIINKQKADAEKLNLHLKLFNDRCNKANIKHKAHIHDGTDIVDFLINESVFADLLILDEHMSFTFVNNHQLSGFVTDILEDARCPVIVAPNSCQPVDTIFLCYDGSPSSVHAIKMFSYLFPEWRSKPTVLVSFSEASSEHLTHSENIKDLLNQHFDTVKIDLEHHSRIGDAMLSYFKLFEENSIIVMGAYGRSALSRFFKKSTANSIIKEVKAPIFITHD